MTRSTLIWRSATHHWRTNLAVGLGAVVGTAVLTGALLVGDSMHGSLLALTHERLGRIDHALVGPRFFRAALPGELAGLSPGYEAAGAILIKGTLERLDDDGTVVRRVGGVSVVGIDAAFLGLFPEA